MRFATFRDITFGNTGYAGVPGWDFAARIGSDAPSTKTMLPEGAIAWAIQCPVPLLDSSRSYPMVAGRWRKPPGSTWK